MQVDEQLAKEEALLQSQLKIAEKENQMIELSVRKNELAI